MTSSPCFAQSVCRRKPGAGLAVGLLTVLIALPLIGVQHSGAPARSAPARSVSVDRSSHGSVRHAQTHVVQRPVQVRSEPVRPVGARPVEARPAPAPAPGRGLAPVGGDYRGHHDVEADLHHPYPWRDFAFGRRWGVLPVGFITLQLGGVPYYYCDGIYYQPADGGYQEVYPPLGADIPQPPDGAIEIDAGGQTYYYAGGAFYVQQPDGTYAVAPTPIGVVVPELPPGAIQVSVNGTIAYQFNGIYYEPVFADGVTQYETFMP